MKGPREIYEEQYKAAGAEAAVLELRLRLLADKIPAISDVAHDQTLEKVEDAVTKHFAAHLAVSESAAFALSRQLRNKIFHCDFVAARKKLGELGKPTPDAGVKRLDVTGLTGNQMLDKLTKASDGVPGTFEKVADLRNEPGVVFGWLIESGEAGDFAQAAEAFKTVVSVVDRLARLP